MSIFVEDQLQNGKNMQLLQDKKTFKIKYQEEKKEKQTKKISKHLTNKRQRLQPQ